MQTQLHSAEKQLFELRAELASLRRRQQLEGGPAESQVNVEDLEEDLRVKGEGEGRKGKNVSQGFGLLTLECSAAVLGI